MVTISDTSIFPYDRKTVFETFRDRLADYTRYVPNVEKVEILERKAISKTQVRIKAKWLASGNIPFIVRAILKPHMLSWRDECVWDSQKFSNHWEITPYFFKEFFQCKGEWHFEQTGFNKTRVKLSGTLSIYIPRFPGVPDMVARGAGAVIERFLLTQLKPNLQQNHKAVKKLLKEMEIHRTHKPIAK